jgi:hypothetical protein
VAARCADADAAAGRYQRPRRGFVQSPAPELQIQLVSVTGSDPPTYKVDPAITEPATTDNPANGIFEIR